MHAIAALLFLTAAQGNSQPPILGRWINPAHSVIIDLAACGDAYCGTVQWASAQAKQDASKGTPNLVGTQLLTDLQQDGDVWEGKLFIPDEQLHATAKIEAIGAEQLKVSGCELVICDSQTWTRADGPLPASD